MMPLQLTMAHRCSSQARQTSDTPQVTQDDAASGSAPWGASRHATSMVGQLGTKQQLGPMVLSLTRRLNLLLFCLWLGGDCADVPLDLNTDQLFYVRNK
jgi:hypothetical protein